MEIKTYSCGFIDWRGIYGTPSDETKSMITRDDMHQIYWRSWSIPNGNAPDPHLAETQRNAYVLKWKNQIQMESLDRDVRQKVEKLINENKREKTMNNQLSLRVINNRDYKFIVMERYSGHKFECTSLVTAQQYCQNNVSQDKEFIILEVKAVAGPKKPEIQWESLENADDNK